MNKNQGCLEKTIKIEDRYDKNKSCQEKIKQRYNKNQGCQEKKLRLSVTKIKFD